MQLMPATAREMGLDTHEIVDPGKNISAGIHYDRVQYERLSEIWDKGERLKFMLASYNCGRGYVNAALRLARADEFGFVPLALVGGKWQTWKFSSPRLADPACMVMGKKPDSKQVWEYVEKIWKKYRQYAAGSLLPAAG
jgi:membrane-bound lytic murein transglycosylase MltF